MKQIDRLLLRSFVGPFATAFAIALFMLLMQYLWVYIDEIIGKGAGLLLITELIGYLSVSMMPMALPVAVLIASVMTMGNHAEHYELAAMKSAGVPLLRIMRPLMLAGFAISAFSFACANYFIPVANLKARTRLYDIRKQKPSLSLEEGAFNDDFQNFSIRIGAKGDDDRTLDDVMLFRQGASLRGRIEAVTAERGVMDVTPDDRYFVLSLADGYQYQEPEGQVRDGTRTYPFVRTRFATYRKTFDLSEFEIERTNEEAFEKQEGMLSVGQLGVAIDSIYEAIDERRDRLGIEVGRFVTPLKRLDRARLDSIEQLRRDSLKLAADLAIAAGDGAADSVARAETPPPATAAKPSRTKLAALQRRAEAEREVTNSELPRLMSGDRLPSSFPDYLLDRPAYKRSSYVDRATQFARTIESYADGAQRRLEGQRSALVRHIYEWHAKWSFASACFIFLFIGAPMGAIIRKGGFGYPILVSIIFFTVFIILMIGCRKLMQGYVLEPAFAAWLPTIVIFPIGLTLTMLAMNDRKLTLPSLASIAQGVGTLVKRLAGKPRASAPAG